MLTASHDPSDVLPFAERTLILQQGRVIADQNTQDLYKNPPDYYTASLFGQVNQIPMKLLKSYSEIERSILVYPHEFKFSDSSGLKVAVMNSFFKGTHYLNEGMAEDGTLVFFNSEKEQEKGTTIFLNVSLNTINKRLQVGQKANT